MGYRFRVFSLCRTFPLRPARLAAKSRIMCGVLYGIPDSSMFLSIR
jgi:hypothetical protein